jgi:signal transduction histidine kinase
LGRLGLDVRLHLPPEPVDLPADVQLAAYRIIQEALTNVLRHASATSAAARVTRDAGALVVQVQDDGRVGPDFRPGTGLLGMRERVASFGGHLDLLARPGDGLRISARLPLDATPAPTC